MKKQLNQEEGSLKELSRVTSGGPSKSCDGGFYRLKRTTTLI